MNHSLRFETALMTGSLARTPGVDAVLTVIGTCENNDALKPYWPGARYLVRWMHEGREVLATLGRSALEPLEAEPVFEPAPAMGSRDTRIAWDRRVFNRGA